MLRFQTAQRLVSEKQLPTKQAVTSPTRLQATLNEVYTNMVVQYADITVLPPRGGGSDHRGVLCKAAIVDTYKPPVVTRMMKQNTNPQNRASFMHALSEIRWECLFRAQTCAEQYQILGATVKTLMDEYLALKLGRHCSTYCPWVTDHFHELVSKRQRAFNRNDMMLCRLCRYRVNRKTKRLRRTHYEQRLNSICANSERW